MGFDYQVSWNSTQRTASLRLIEMGPRGRETEKIRLTRTQAAQLHDDLGRAIVMMDSMIASWGTPESGPSEPIEDLCDDAAETPEAMDEEPVDWIDER